MNEKKYKPSRITDSSGYLIIVIAACIFVAETVAMLIIDALIHPLKFSNIVLDSVILVVLISPALYFFVFRRFVIHITEERKSEQLIYRQSRILDAINKVLKEALTCKTEEELANMCLALAEKMTGSKFGFLGEINKDGRFDTIAISNPGWDACKMPDSDATRLIKDMEIRGIDRVTMREEKSRIVNDPSTHPDKVGMPEGHPPLTSFLGVPLKREGKTIGMIGLGNKESGYNAEDQHAIEILAVSFVEALTSKRAETALRDSREKFKTMTTTANDAIIMVDNDDCISFWNEAAEKIFGFSRVEIMGTKLHEKIIPAGLRAAHIKGFKSFRDTGQGAVIGKTVEFTAINKSGTEFPIELSLSSVKRGDKWNAVSIIRDITERNRMKDKLGVLRELDRSIITHTLDYDEVFEGATHLISELIPCDRVTIVLVDEEKEGFIYNYGWGAKIRKKGDFVPFGETDATRVVKEHRTIQRQDLSQEKALARLDKEFFEEGFLSDIRIPLKTGGKVKALLNIGSRKAHRFNKIDANTFETIADQLSIAMENSTLYKELEQSRNKVTGILESITDSFFALDSEWRFVYVNPAAGIQLQRNHELLLGKNIWEEFSEAISTKFYTEYYRAVAEKVTVNFKEFYPPLNKWFEVSAYPSGKGLSVYFRDITEHKQISETRRQHFEMLREAQDGTIQALETMIEMRDPYTAGHERRVADLSVAIAEELGLTSMQVDGIKMAGIIHDIGKISVPAEILSKPGKITEAEFNIIKGHCQMGYDILKDIKFPWPIAEIVLQHQERLDGSGYPNGLKDAEILMESKIIAVADTVEAMSSHRPYRPALGIDTALEEITKNKGIFYDPDSVDACTRLFREKGFKLKRGKQ